MSKDLDESYKTGFETYQKLAVFLVHKAGGEVQINQGEFLNFSDRWEIENTLDTLTGQITIKVWATK